MFAAFLSLILVVALADLDDVGQLSESESKYLLHWTGWPAEIIDEAVQVMTCESRRVPDRIGDSGKGWKYAEGMEAIQSKTIDNIVTNSMAALVIYQKYGGWREWTCKPEEVQK